MVTTTQPALLLLCAFIPCTMLALTVDQTMTYHKSLWEMFGDKWL